MASSHTSTILDILQKGGFNRQQAQTIADAIAEAHRGSDAVTNSSLDLRLKELELRLTNTLTNRVLAIVSVGVAILALLIKL